MEFIFVGGVILLVIWLDNMFGWTDWLVPIVYKFTFEPLEKVLNGTPDYWHIPLAIGASLVIAGLVVVLFL